MLLADNEILELVEKGELIVEGFKHENLTPNGYDLSIREVLIPSKGESIKEGSAQIPPLTWFLIGTEEVVELPKGITGQLWIRTSWARKGVMASFGKVDAGFRGDLTFSAFNASSNSIEVPIGSKFAQIIFMRMSTKPSKAYEERSGNYQNQRGITLEPKKTKK